MNGSFNPSLMQRTLDLQYEKKKRSHSLKWSIINGVLFIVFVYDLSCKCPNYTSAFHYVEYALSVVVGVSMLQHGYQLFKRSPPLTITPRQRDLLGIDDADTSFNVVDSPNSGSDMSDVESESQSVSLSQCWRRDAGSRSVSASPPEPARTQPEPDHFIADEADLSDYLRQYEERSILESSMNVNTSNPPPISPPHYQLATMDKDSMLDDSGTNDRSGLGGAPQAWWRLQLDPQKLTDWNLNLRLWLHVTILERLVREMASVELCLARIGLHDVKIGQVSVERLSQSTKSAGCGMLAAILPFLEPYADQKYLVQRIKELAEGGCLSNFRWNGGGSEHDDCKPTDAELILHLLATYLDGQLPGTGKPFSENHLSSAPNPPPRGPSALSIHRMTTHPPHYVLALEDDTIEVGRGRNNLLHTILLLVAACARRTPPALHRVHLGPAGLNMLWIIS